MKIGLETLQTNLKKSLILLMILIGVSIVYAATLAFYYFSYKQWAELMLNQYPIEVRPYIDVKPFFATSQGFILMLCGAGLTILYVICAVAFFKGGRS